MSKVLRTLYDEEVKLFNIKARPNEPNRKNKRYRISKSVWKDILEYRSKGVTDSCNALEVDPTTVKHLWKKTKNESVFVKNPLYKEQLEKDYNDLIEHFETNIDKFIKKSVKRSKIKHSKVKNSCLFDVAVITDVHIGMNPNPNGYSLYGGKWDAKELNERKEILIQRILKTKKSNKLILFDLGDFMDGWDGETVRRGHKLPQNMTNEEAFDVAFDFKLSLADALVNHYEEIEFININDDNHAGAFAYVVNSPFKKFVEQRYNNVKVYNQRKFIDHYIYGNKVFVATHGKDGNNLKFGFKPKLDPIQIEKIENYLFEHNLIRKDLEIYFIKGDSHQDIFDNSTSQKFKYWNFPAFSPSSNWVQTNFKKGISGFYTFNFEEDCYSPHPYYFKWK